MDRTIKWGSALAALAVVVAACQGAASPTPGPTATGTATAPPATATPAPTPTPGYPTGEINLTMWTKEGDPNINYVKTLAANYSLAHPNVSIEVVNKEVEALREDFQTASLAGNAPEILWTVSDHIGPFTTADIIRPVDDLIDPSVYLDVALANMVAGGHTWGVPISYGNQLMLYWNKTLVPEAPADFDALVAKAKELTDSAAGKYGLVYNQTEPFWTAPFLGGFGGAVFAADGVTPTLDTPEMKATLEFLYNLKFTDKIVPSEADYAVSDSLFKDGSAAMIVNGDWALADYLTALGDNLGLGPIPKIVATGKYPAPYTAGTFFMIPKELEGDELTVVADFMKWSTTKEQQVEMVTELRRLPANLEALSDPIVTGDTYLAGAAEAVKVGTPMPTNVEMRCVWDSWKPAITKMYAGDSGIDALLTEMQSSAESCIAAQG